MMPTRLEKRPRSMDGVANRNGGKAARRDWLPISRTLVLLAALVPATPICQARQAHTDTPAQQKLLELRRKHLTVRQAKAKFEERKKLVEAGLVAHSEIEAAETAYLQAQLDYQQTFLSLFSQTPRITVLRAVKRIVPGGRRSVSLTLRNDAVGNLDYSQLGVIEGEAPLPDQMKLREVSNVYVSLKDSSGVIVSRPYEQFLAHLQVGVETSLEFELLKDVETVTVGLSYGGQSEDQREVFLEKDASANVVTVQSGSFSQEADLGGSALYDLKLERFTSEAHVFRLGTLNLPESIEHTFVSISDTETRLSQIQFVEGETTKDLALRLSLPELPDPKGFPLDQPIRFTVLVLPGRQTGGTGGGEPSAAVGKTELELIPRGTAKLEVRIPNLFQSVLLGEEIHFRGSVRNIGTRAVRGIRITSDIPFGWMFEARPASIERLETGEDRPVEISIRPPEDIAVGDYTLKFLTEAFVNNKAVRSEDKIARVKISAPASLVQSGLTAGILGILLFAIVGIGFKMMKR